VNIDGFGAEWLWLLAALLLALAELLAPGVFLIFLAIAAALVGLITLATGFDLPFQLALFPLLSLGAVYVGRRWYHRHNVKTSDPLLNDRLARHLGETVLVVAAIENGQGRVRLGDSIWPARGPDAPEGSRVRIIGAQGTSVTVEPIDTNPSSTLASR
jgi:inner membrane protein